MRSSRSLLVLASILLTAACGDDDGSAPAIDATAGGDGGPADAAGPDGHLPDADLTPDASTALRPLPITIVGQGLPPLPHLSGSQTPTDYTIGISRLELLRSEDDADPVLALELGAGVAVPMDTVTQLAVMDLADVPPDTYTHLRVRLTQVRLTVDATAHAGIFTDMGKVTITAALADTTIDGEAWPKGKGHLTYVGLVTQESDIPVPPLPTPKGVLLEETDEETFLIIPIGSPAVITDNAADDPEGAQITFYTGDSFVWTDLELDGYLTDVWDVSTNNEGVEPVVGFGARAFAVSFGPSK